MAKVCFSVSLCLCYLGSQQSGQVDFRNHLAASVAFSLVTVLMILHQVPQFSSWKHTSHNAAEEPRPFKYYCKNSNTSKSLEIPTCLIVLFGPWTRTSAHRLLLLLLVTPIILLLLLLLPVSWSGVIIGALDLRLSGLLDVRSNDSEDKETVMSYLLWVVMR